jgi:small conductance mechanosensitive channel
MDALLEFLAVDRAAELIDVQQLSTMVFGFLPKLITALVIMFGFWVGFKVLRRGVGGVLRRGGMEPTLVTLLVDRIFKFVVFATGSIMAADQLGVNVAAALAGLGVAGIAVGFAAQDMLANIIAGFVVFWDKPFRVGDYIRVAGEYGQVRDITLRSTRIRTNQNSYIVIPNKNIVDDVLVNQSEQGQLRLDVPIGIAYKEDIGTARTVLLRAMADVPEVLKDPAPAIAVVGLGDSSVDLEVRVWIANARAEQPTEVEVVEAAKIALDAAGIQIPFPHMQLFVDDVTDRAVKQLSRARA